MKAIVKRPPVLLNPGSGVLRNDHFQMAYVTNDIERACDVFRQRYGIKAFQTMGGATPAGGEIRVELAWAGGTMYELVHASGPGTDFYNNRLPAEGFAIRHHHLGFFVQDQEGWDALLQEIERDRWPVAYAMDMEDFIFVRYIEAPELGHYLEYMYPAPAAVEFFENVPRS
jgi:hypothetical protein